MFLSLVSHPNPFSMRTLSLERVLICAVLACICYSANAQNDGDHAITDGFGRTYLAPDAQVGGTVNPDGFTVGTTPNANAALVVEGSQMANPTGEVFRTYTSTNADSFWRMFRRPTGVGGTAGREHLLSGQRKRHHRYQCSATWHTLPGQQHLSRPAVSLLQHLDDQWLFWD